MAWSCAADFRTDFLVHNLAGIGHRQSRAVHHPPGARNSRCNSSSEQSGPTPKMTRHRHSTVLEWHVPSGVVSYIDLDRLEVFVQQGHAMDVSVTFRYGGAVISAQREVSQQHTRLSPTMRDSTTSVYTYMEPLSHVHQVVGLFTEGVRTIRSLSRRQNHAARRCETDILSTYARVDVLVCVGC